MMSHCTCFAVPGLPGAAHLRACPLYDETVREIPADELAEAERQIRHLGTTFPNRHGKTVEALMAEYDERGRLYERWHGRYLELEAQSAATRAELERELDAARAEVAELRGRAAEARAIVHWWTRRRLDVREDLPVVLVAKLDALAAAHEETP